MARKRDIVPTSRMVPAPLTEEAPASNAPPSDDYWPRALGKTSAPRGVPQGVVSPKTAPIAASRTGQTSVGDSDSSDWDRASGTTSRRAGLPHASSAFAQPGNGVRGAHAKAGDPLAAIETNLSEAAVLGVEGRGAHVRAVDPFRTEVETDGVQNGAENHDTVARARRRPLKLVPLAGAVAALTTGLGGGAAYAYFTSHGSGTGHATGGTPSNVILGQATIGTVSKYLVPGGTGDLFVKVNNPNNFAVTVTGISQTGGVTVSGSMGTCTNDPAWPGTLGTSGMSVPTNSSLNVSVPANSGSSFQVDIPNAASMTSSTATGCQGATFQIPITITVRQQ